MTLEQPEPRIEYSEDPHIKTLQVGLINALERLGHNILEVSLDETYFDIKTNKADIRIEHGIFPENSQSWEMAMKIQKYLTRDQIKKIRQPNLKGKTETREEMVDEIEKWVNKTYRLSEKKEKKIIEELKKTVFARVELQKNPNITRVPNKYTCEFSIKQKFPKITQTSKAVRGEIQKNLDDTRRKEPPPDEENLAWTVEK